MIRRSEDGPRVGVGRSSRLRRGLRLAEQPSQGVDQIHQANDHDYLEREDRHDDRLHGWAGV
jgi:hypothetical protein